MPWFSEGQRKTTSHVILAASAVPFLFSQLISKACLSGQSFSILLPGSNSTAIIDVTKDKDVEWQVIFS